jgi:hypothetical protein
LYRARNFSSSYVRSNLVRSISWLTQTNYIRGEIKWATLIGLFSSADRPYQIISYVRVTKVLGFDLLFCHVPISMRM